VLEFSVKFTFEKGWRAESETFFGHVGHGAYPQDAFQSLMDTVLTEALRQHVAAPVTAAKKDLSISR
jgi:hypothetical protein